MKNILRKQFLGKRNHMCQEDALEKSTLIINKLCSLKQYHSSEAIFTYVSMKKEVDTFSLIERALEDNKHVAVPKTYGKGIMKFYYLQSLDDLELGNFGVLEPKYVENEAISSKNDICIVPGTVFDLYLNRIGYGGGYYDRYLKDNVFFSIIGLAYDFQVIDEIKTEDYDRKVDLVITESNILL